MCGKEGVGFEPTGDLAATTRLANERNRPDSAIPPKKELSFDILIISYFFEDVNNKINIFYFFNKKIFYYYTSKNLKGNNFKFSASL